MDAMSEISGGAWGELANFQPLEAIADLEKHGTITPDARKLFNKLKKMFTKGEAA